MTLSTRRCIILLLRGLRSNVTTPSLIVLTKIGFRRPAAATFVGVSPTTFDSWVKEDKMPRPYRIGGVVIWRGDQLVEAFNRLTGVETGKLETPVNS